MRTINKKLKYYLFTSAANIILIFSSGAIVQSFLSSIGLSNEQIGFYTLVINIVQVLTLILSTYISDKIKNVPKIIAFFTLPALVFFAAMVYICVVPVQTHTAFVIAIAACCFWNFFYGIRIVIEYKLPYYVTDISEYPEILSTSGIILSILGIGVSASFVFFSKMFRYTVVTGVSFGLSIIFVLIAFFAVRSLKNENNNLGEIKSGKIRWDILKLPQTKFLALPNFIRGISNGIMAMAAVVMLSCVTKDESVSSMLTTVSAVATVVSCFIYRIVYKKANISMICIIGGIVEFIGVLFILAGNVKIFTIMYFIAFAGQVIADYSIPVFVTEIVPYSFIGSYTAIRMLLFTSGAAVGNYIAGMMSSKNPGLLMIICGLAQIINVTWYYVYTKLYKKNGEKSYVIQRNYD